MGLASNEPLTTADHLGLVPGNGAFTPIKHLKASNFVIFNQELSPAASSKGMLTIQELSELLPHGPESNPRILEVISVFFAKKKKKTHTSFGWVKSGKTYLFFVTPQKDITQFYKYHSRVYDPLYLLWVVLQGLLLYQSHGATKKKT